MQSAWLKYLSLLLGATSQKSAKQKATVSPVAHQGLSCTSALLSLHHSSARHVMAVKMEGSVVLAGACRQVKEAGSCHNFTTTSLLLTYQSSFWSSSFMNGFPAQMCPQDGNALVRGALVLAGKAGASHCCAFRNIKPRITGFQLCS
jgi:hypothetical protein